MSLSICNRINFVNLSGFTIMLEFWFNSRYDSLCIKSSSIIHKLNSSTGEYHINNAYLEQECSDKWKDNGFNLSVYDIGKFRSQQSHQGNYWMYDSDFDCVYDKILHQITFIKKRNPEPLFKLIMDSVISMDKLITLITKMKCNKCYSIYQIDMINQIIKTNNLQITDNSQLITLNKLNILSEINIIKINYNYPEEDYPYFINEILPILTNLTELCFSDSFNLPIDGLNSLVNIEKIFFGYNFNQSICSLSNLTNLVELVFDFKFNQTVDILPNSIQKIQLDNDEQIKLFPEKYHEMLITYF